MFNFPSATHYAEKKKSDSYNFEPGCLTDQKKQLAQDLNKLQQSKDIFKMYKKEIASINLKKKCAKCRTWYTDKTNFQLECKYHPGVIDEYTNRYTCCGTDPNNEVYKKKGCRKCDHKQNTRNYTIDETTCIPVCLVSQGIINIKNNMIVDIKEHPEDYKLSYFEMQRCE